MHQELHKGRVLIENQMDRIIRLDWPNIIATLVLLEV